MMAHACQTPVLHDNLDINDNLGRRHQKTLGSATSDSVTYNHYIFRRTSCKQSKRTEGAKRSRVLCPARLTLRTVTWQSVDISYRILTPKPASP